MISEWSRQVFWMTCLLGKYFVYLASCDEARLIFMEPSPEEVTGFTMEEMIAGGMDMQISRIHPDDISSLYDKALRIIQKNSEAAQHGKTNHSTGIKLPDQAC